MDQKQRFFIYDRKEMGVLLLLGLMVAVFAFTLGVHLGKRVAPKPDVSSTHQAEAVETLPDQVPNRQELTEQGKGAQQAADESLNESLKEEVDRTGLRLDTARQVQLPEQPLSQNAGATTDTKPSASPRPIKKAASSDAPKSAVDSESAQTDFAALRRVPPEGRFTLQIGSYPSLEEARDQSESLEALGLKPFVRPAEVKGRQWYRVYLDGFPNREMAEKAGARLLGQHKIEAYVVSKMVDP